MVNNLIALKKSLTNNSSLTKILNQLNNYFKKTYLEKLEKVILFGSQARGEATEDSDIDILIILNNNFNDHQESKKISYFICDLCLEYDVVITYFFTTLEKWKNTNNAFFRNIRKEGIIL